MDLFKYYSKRKLHSATPLYNCEWTDGNMYKDCCKSLSEVQDFASPHMFYFTGYFHRLQMSTNQAAVHLICIEYYPIKPDAGLL